MEATEAKVTPTKPHFFKPLLPGFHHGLSIPKSFYNHYLNDDGKSKNRDAVLRTVLGQWKVKIKDGRFYEDGWRGFAQHHDLHVGDMVVFRYEGDLVFDVLVFDPSACERCYDHDDDHQSVPLVVKQEDSLQKSTDDQQPFLIRRSDQLLNEQVPTTEECQIKIRTDLQTNKVKREFSGYPAESFTQDPLTTEEFHNEGLEEKDTQSTQESGEASADIDEEFVQDENTNDSQKLSKEGESPERFHATFPLPSRPGRRNPRRKRKLDFRKDKVLAREPEKQPQPPKGRGRGKKATKAPVTGKKRKAREPTREQDIDHVEAVALDLFMKKNYRSRKDGLPNKSQRFSMVREWEAMDQFARTKWLEEATRFLESTQESSESKDIESYGVELRSKDDENEDAEVPQERGASRAFIRYRVERLKYYRHVLKPHAITPDLVDQIREAWASMSAEQKEPYLRKAAEERQRRKELHEQGLMQQKAKRVAKNARVQERLKERENVAKQGQTKGAKKERWQSYMSLPWIKRLFKEMTKEQKVWINKIGLGGLEHLNIDSTSEKFNAFIYNAYDPSNQSVCAHGRVYMMTNETVKWLFGVSCTGEVLEPEDADVNVKVLAHKLDLTKPYIGVNAYGEWFLKKENQQLTEEWKRRAVIFILACFGMPNTKFGVRQTLVQYVVDLERLENVNWAGTWFEFLKAQQRPVKLKVAIRGAGCILIPMMVYLEKFVPKYHEHLKKCQGIDAFPRLKFWNNANMASRWAFVTRHMDYLELVSVNTSKDEVHPEIGTTNASDEMLMRVTSCIAPVVKEVVGRILDQRLGRDRRINVPEEKSVKEEETTSEADAQGESQQQQPTMETSVTSPPKQNDASTNEAVSQLLSSKVASNKPPIRSPASPPFNPAYGSPKMVQLKKNVVIPRKKGEGKGTVKGPKRTSSRVQRSGVFDEILPRMPTLDECFLHFYLSREAVPDISKYPTLRTPFKDDYLVDIAHGVATIGRDYSWQLESPRYFGDMMIDCISHILHLTDKYHTDGERKIWFLPCLYSVLGQKNVNDGIHEQFLGDFDLMRMISVPLNVTDVHYLLMVLHFDEQKVYILDPMAKLLYNTQMIHEKLQQLHTNFNMSLPHKYSHVYNIRTWDIVWSLDDIPRQINMYDCGGYVCFYMANLRQLIPEPRKKIKINEDFIRIWVANFIGRSVYNDLKDVLLENCNKFKYEDGIEEQFVKKYKYIPTVFAAYHGRFI